MQLHSKYSLETMTLSCCHCGHQYEWLHHGVNDTVMK